MDECAVLHTGGDVYSRQNQFLLPTLASFSLFQVLYTGTLL